MPVYITPQKVKMRQLSGNNSDQFYGLDVVAAETTAEQVAAINSATNTATATINSTANTATTNLNTAVTNANAAANNLNSQVQAIATAIVEAEGNGTDPTLTLSNVAADAKATGDAIDNLKSAVVNPPLFSIIRNGKVYGNLWDEDIKAYGRFAIPSGQLMEGDTAWYYSPTYIPVNAGDVIAFNNSRPIGCAYDSKGNVVGCEQLAWAGYTVPSGVMFMRFAVAVATATGMIIRKYGQQKDIEAAQKTQLYIPNLIIKKPTITVAANGDYTSLTEALYATADDHPDVFVKVGTYDIVAEYKALFGNNIFDTMTYETTGMKNFQWGLYIDNRTVTFAAGAKVVCDMSAYTNDGTRRFSPFNLGMNAVIDGLDCYAVNPYYIIHDDFGDASEAFTNVIRNCKLVSPEPAQGNVIGGGCRMYSTKIVDNCWLDNGNNKPVAMRYHNYSTASTAITASLPVVIIKNTRANSKIRLNYYGKQTTHHMTAYVNNCKALAIEKAAEDSNAVDNVDLYEWCNEVGS